MNKQRKGKVPKNVATAQAKAEADGEITAEDLAEFDAAVPYPSENKPVPGTKLAPSSPVCGC